MVFGFVFSVTLALLAALVFYEFFTRKDLAVGLKQRFEAEADGEIFAGTSLKKKRDNLKQILLLLRPIAELNNLLPLIGIKKGINRLLISANKPLTVNEFLAIQELSGFFALLLYIYISSNREPTYMLAFFVIGMFVPLIMLRSSVKKRKQQIARDLPNVIDILNLCVGAGLDFMLALRRVIRDYKECELIEELTNVWRQIQMGRARSEALKHMAWRVNMPEITSFVRALVQGDRMGTPISDILRQQAEEMRTYRYLLAEEEAMKAPVKMLFPLLFCIMPAILIIVAGPILLEFMKGDLLKTIR